MDKPLKFVLMASAMPDLVPFPAAGHHCPLPVPIYTFAWKTGEHVCKQVA